MNSFRMLLAELVLIATAALCAGQDTAAPVVLKYVPQNTVGGIFLQPRRFLQSDHLQTLIKAGDGSQFFDERMATAERELGLDLRTVEEFAVFIDRVKGDTPVDEAPQRDTRQLLNNLKQFGLSMHNMHDVYNSFPADDGADTPDKGNLSWRVWMLPFLEEAALFNEFHLNEPWDSEHNKTLIKKMPAIFKTPGVKDADKTSLHLFTGKGSPFHDHNAPGIRDILDGTSNTLMCVLAGPDKAEIWTKPGGLDFDPANPIAAVGDVKESLLAAMMDGSVHEIPLDTDPTTLANLIQHQDGNPVDFNRGGRRDFGRDFSKWPAFFVRTTTPIDQEKLLATAFPKTDDQKSQTIAGLKAREFRGMWVVFPDERTMLAAPEALLKRSLEKRATPTLEADAVAAIRQNDAYVFGEFELVKELIGQNLRQLPMAGIAENLVSAEFAADFSSDKRPFNEATVVTANAITAQQISALLQGGIQMANAQMLAASTQPDSQLSPELAQSLSTLFNSVKVEARDTNVHYVVPKPEKMSDFLTVFGPGVKLAVEQSRRAERMNNLKQIGLAFHNYHDVYGHFPFPDRGPAADPDQKQGLSWRVHILPFVDQVGLYQQFRLDEPWDSDHNKTLIDKMPAVYKVEGVAAAGQTSVHVFVGENTPFDGDRTPEIRNFLDGTSNTILAIEAGPDTAVPWTKPGGLELDPKNPKKSLGKLGEQFLVLMADGSVRFVSSTIDDETLSHLIQPDDGHAIGDF
ncbi:MAG: DUF1559 domain-containing protein [Planctomycetaceae bacterium]